MGEEGREVSSTDDDDDDDDDDEDDNDDDGDDDDDDEAPDVLSDEPVAKYEVPACDVTISIAPSTTIAYVIWTTAVGLSVSDVLVAALPLRHS